MDLSYDDVQEILKIIDSSSVEELHLEIGDFKLVVKKKGATTSVEGSLTAAAEDAGAAERAAQPASVWPEGAEPAAVAGAKAVAGARAEVRSRPVRQGGHEVKAPMVGTFYRAPAPGAPAFVELGSLVTEDDTVGIIEVMKLMNSIKAGCRGRVVEICVENGAMVEFGQTLTVIEPLG
ncbi:MAG: acetyl-CoA carboxylase biotin carboxyl carrier protein [Candidatus Rokubacteria bacterium]|nr:acetyl-CoA carboxylase biotin carboxyl carrier protein [Candidatus Rokubacteria bacterium]